MPAEEFIHLLLCRHKKSYGRQEMISLPMLSRTLNEMQS